MAFYAKYLIPSDSLRNPADFPVDIISRHDNAFALRGSGTGQDMNGAVNITDALAEDRQDWIESIDYIHERFGEEGVREILRNVQDHILSRGVTLNEATLNTPYVHPIPLARQPLYPGDIELEKRIENIIRWNAMAMVLQGQDQGTGVGGHIATYTSAASITCAARDPTATAATWCWCSRTPHPASTRAPSSRGGSARRN